MEKEEEGSYKSCSQISEEAGGEKPSGDSKDLHQDLATGSEVSVYTAS